MHDNTTAAMAAGLKRNILVPRVFEVSARKCKHAASARNQKEKLPTGKGASLSQVNVMALPSRVPIERSKPRPGPGTKRA